MPTDPTPTDRGLLAALRRVPPKLWLRLALLLALVAGGVALLRFTPLGELFTEERMIAFLEGLRGWVWTPLLLIGSYSLTTVLCLPASPVMMGGAIVFGPWWGSLYNTLGLLAGAMTAYYVAKLLGRGFVEHLVGSKLRRAERIFERQGFWPLVQVRFLPIPFPVVSYGAALAGVRPMLFFLTTAIGVTPATVLHTCFIHALWSRPSVATGTLYVATFTALNLVLGWKNFRDRWQRRRRYRQLLDERRAKRSA